MRIFGLDFTSAPGRRKPITCIVCTLNGSILQVEDFLTIPTFAAFETFLQTPGPWLAALDFPFGQPRKLITNLHWPATWAEYIQLVAAMDKTTIEETLTAYRQSSTTVVTKGKRRDDVDSDSDEQWPDGCGGKRTSRGGRDERAEVFQAGKRRVGVCAGTLRGTITGKPAPACV